MPPQKLVAGSGRRAIGEGTVRRRRGSHATPSEVAVTQFAYPEAIKSAPLDPEIAPRGDFSDAADYRRNFPDGRIGSNSALATPEAGRRLYDAAVAALTKDYLAWVAP
jgi:creatinine amidohydrolase